MEEKAIDGLKVNMTVDITTIGRKSGEPRRIEIWSPYFDGRVFITSSPGKRSWYANLIANPHFTYHLKGQRLWDLPAIARPITCEGERRAILARLKEVSPYWAKHMDAIEDWGRGSRLVEVMLM